MSNHPAKPFSHLLSRLSDSSVFSAVRKGLICMMPLFIIGSAAILLSNLPIPFYQEGMTRLFGAGWKNFPAMIQQGTFSIVSLGALLLVSYFLAQEKSKKLTNQITVVITPVLSLCCFFIIQHVEDGNLAFGRLGQSNMLLAIIISVAATSLFFFFHNHKIIKAKLFTDDADILFTQMLNVLEPTLWTVLCFTAFKMILLFFNITDLNSFVYDTLKSSILPTEANLFSAIYYTLSVHFFWFFGIHGTAVMTPVLMELWWPLTNENIAMAAENATLLEAGLTPVNAPHILNDAFFDVFVTLGGSGATLCLIAALLIKARKTNDSKLAKFSLPMALFNISEPMVYGLPIVLNPVYLIPFLLVPAVLTVTTWLAMTLHLVPPAIERVSWTTPILISGYQATGSIWGAVLQVVNLAVGIAVYLPFVAIARHLKTQAHHKVLQALNQAAESTETKPSLQLLDRQDEVGYLARSLSYDLKTNINNNTNLFLMFQPQVGAPNRLYGCEALLRWEHQNFGFIPPPTIIAIAEEAGVHSQLNEWIFRTALEMLAHIREQGQKDLIMSINISPLQLNNPNIPQIIAEAISKYQFDPHQVEVELTENVVLDDSSKTRQALERFKEIGVRLAIDDFGMGHTSIQYFRSHRFDTVKLDGSLVSDIVDNESSKDIVRALVNLAASQNMKVIAEFVENAEQRNVLLELGCLIYQGYFYSKPLHADSFENYMAKTGLDTAPDSPEQSSNSISPP